MNKSFTIVNAAVPSTARTDIGSRLGCSEITSDDVVELRRSIAEAALSVEDVEALFALDRADLAKCPEWASFFVEAVTDYIVWQARPTGIVDQAQAEWLVRQVDRAKTLAGFSILINVLAEADRVPGWLVPAARARAAAWPDIAGAVAVAAAEARRAA